MLDDEKVAIRRRTSGVHVFVVDDHRRPLTGEDVTARFFVASVPTR
jgi:hypothetical protein